MIMRRDDEPIAWPEPTHGNPNDSDDAARIAAGQIKPWVTVAECIDFALRTPSIFDSVEAIRQKIGIRAKRPLAPKTLARLAKGVKRYVLDAPLPFLVKVNHTARNEARDRGIERPLSAVTGKRDDALVMPFVAYAQHGGAVRPADALAHTITASRKDQNAIVVPYLVPRYGERTGQEPRTCPADHPGPTPVPTGNEGSLAAVHMMTMRNSDAPSSAADHPARTIVADGAAPTLVAAYIAQHNTDMVGHDVRKPVSTIVGNGSTQNLVAAHMLTLRGTDRRDASAEEPSRTSSTQGSHNAVVSLPLMTVYYGTDEDGALVNRPSRTETAKPRFGLVEVLANAPPFSPEYELRAREVAEFLRERGCWDGGEFVTIEVDGITLVIVDLCMRMLTPRERFNANGFPRDYIIDHGIDENGERINFTLEQQGYMCGNAVCPTEAAALIGANYRPRKVARPRRRIQPTFPLLEAAE
jgi:DNA (cytosine-5)-methyltransferase 1